MTDKAQADAKKRHEDTPLEGTDLSASEKASARKEGAQEAAKQAAQKNVELSTGTENNEVESDPFLGSDEIMMWSHVIDFGLDQFKEAIAEDSDHPIPENKVAGLYKLERNGPNRTEYVKAMRARLGLKKGEDVPGAGGPSYTNDITNLTDL